MKRIRKPKPKAPPAPYVPTFQEATVMLARTLSVLSVSGIRIEWINHNGDLIITFKGMMLETNKETGQARIVKTSEVVADAVSKVAAEKVA